MGPVLTMMGLLSILGILSAAAFSVDHVHTELQVSEVQVSWLTNVSMEIKIGRKHTDIILLTPASNIPGMDTPCLFSGHLGGDPKSVVAVSGCVEDVETSLSIASIILPSGIIDISLVGGQSYHVTADEDYAVLAQKRSKREVKELEVDFLSRSRRRGRSDDYEDYDYEEDDFITPPTTQDSVGTRQFLSSLPKKVDDYEDYDYGEEDFMIPPPTQNRASTPKFSGPLPKKVVLETVIKYDNSLLDHFDGSHTKTKEWLSRVIELVKPRMSDATLTMPITLKTGKIEHTNARLTANKQTLLSIISTDSPSSLTTYFCEDILGESKLRGMSFTGSACMSNGYAASITELFTTSNSELRTARNFAHELGHTVGMKHDFDKEHGGRTGPCNKEGLMSYGRNRPDKWSDCSNKDFTEWWMKEGYTCIKEARSQLTKVNCDCQCSNLRYSDGNGKTHGNCKSSGNGAPWCFVDPLGNGDGSTCGDKQTSKKGPYDFAWSYEACATPAKGTTECPAT